MTGLDPPLIRNAEEDDRVRLVAIMEATWREIWAPHLPDTADQTWREQGVAELLIDQIWAFCLVAEISEAVVGFAHLSSDEVTTLHVDPASKRQGVGRALMAAAEKQLRSLGFRRLRVETEAFNTLAHTFYVALGYEEVRRFTGDIIGYEVPCKELSKPL